MGTGIALDGICPKCKTHTELYERAGSVYLCQQCLTKFWDVIFSDKVFQSLKRKEEKAITVEALARSKVVDREKQLIKLYVASEEE
jgi:GTP cyclohydrolase FolE2